MEDQFAAAAGGVQVLLKALEADTLLLKRVNRLDQMLEAPSQAVELPDDERIAFSQGRQRLLQTFPLPLRSASAILEDLFAPGLLQGILLQIQALIQGRHPRIANERSSLLSCDGMPDCNRNLAVRQ